MPTPLHRNLDRPRAERPDATAVVDPATGHSVTYAELGRLADRVRDRLVALGVGPGDRVGLWCPKSIDSIAAIYGILQAGAAYVPVDPTAPAGRNAFILADCEVAAAVVGERFLAGLAEESTRLESTAPPAIALGGEEGAEDRLPLAAALDRLDEESPAPPAPTRDPSPDHLAYILYTSGSTGRPKGVMLSHENATSFVDWCSDTFEPSPEDRFSSHAPLHFDLSILDVHLSLKHGATLVLIGEEAGKEPAGLARLIADQKITSWYSAPSILALLAQYGRLDQLDLSALERVLFAGEVFPVKHLRTLKQLLPHPRYFNLYGPTETNVCTWYEIPDEIPEERTEPYPIGHVCSHLEGMVVDAAGGEVEPGEEGELLIHGPGVTSGYWNLPERNAEAFLEKVGRSWYRTGDLVVEDPEEGYIFRGRRDRMIKKRGYRIELGEIESALYQHPRVEECGVVAVTDDDGNVMVKAFLGTGGEKLSMIRLKAFCAERLPLYMVPDRFEVRETLPKTSTAKVDYQALLRGD